MDCPKCNTQMKAWSLVTGFHFTDNAVMLVALETLAWVLIVTSFFSGWFGIVIAGVALLILVWPHRVKPRYKCAGCGHVHVEVRSKYN